MAVGTFQNRIFGKPNWRTKLVNQFRAVHKDKEKKKTLANISGSFFAAEAIFFHLRTKVSGKVIDEKNNPLPYVSVVLQSIQDSSYVGGVATNLEGLFTLPVKADVEYAIGYMTVNRTCKAGDIGIIVMKEDAMMLEEVSVIASRTQHDANGYTVNLRSSEIAKGKQSSDALAFLPGVSNEDGSYKWNIRIFPFYIQKQILINQINLEVFLYDCISIF